MEEKRNIWDLVVIGGGPGGYEAAIEAAKRGLRTALVEKEALGGTCLNRGCIPTKTLLHTAELFHEIGQGEKLGFTADGYAVSMEALQNRKREVVEQLKKGVASLMKMNKITVFAGNGSILDQGLVKAKGAGESQILHTVHILIATGSVPSCPPIPGADLPGVLTSDGLLEKKELFDHLLIIGGGVIGMEFASIYSSLGRRVTVIEAMDRILPGMDREIGQNLKMILKKRGVDIHTGARVEKIEKEGAGLACCFSEKESPGRIAADGILIATGRRPWTDGLFDEESSPQIKEIKTERGRILVDEHFETGLAGVYAIGDVIGGVQLAHAASAQGRIAAAHMAGEASDIRVDLIPSCVYTSPEIGCVGISADEAKERGIPVITKKYPMSANGKSVITLQERGFIKVVADSESRRILGAQMMCARATDMISQFTQAIANNLTIEDMEKVVYPHPTFSEGIGEAVRG